MHLCQLTISSNHNLVDFTHQKVTTGNGQLLKVHFFKITVRNPYSKLVCPNIQGNHSTDTSSVFRYLQIKVCQGQRRGRQLSYKKTTEDQTQGESESKRVNMIKLNGLRTTIIVDNIN